MNENLTDLLTQIRSAEKVMPVTMQMGGEVQPMPEMMPPQADNSMLESAINDLMSVRDQATDPLEAQKAEHLAEGMRLAVEAPMSGMAQELSAMGRGDDTQLVHVQPGEVVLPPEMFDDAQFEQAVESRFNELDLDPERYVVGMGIASLNPSTGLEEFGFFKKVGKFFKKIVKPVAKVAQFVPGPWQAPAALISKASTVVDVARGKANPLALAGVFGPGATGGTFSENLKNITQQGGIRGTFSGIRDAFSKGIGNLVENPLKTLFGKTTDPGGGITTLRDLIGSATFSGQPRVALSSLTQEQIDSLSPDELAALQEQEQMANQGGFLGNLISGTGADDTGRFGYLGDALAGIFGQGQAQAGNQGLFGQGGPGLGQLGIAALLGKLAYDQAKNVKGVPLTPMTQMDAMGRFNIEAEIARRMGQDAPNPVEFGLMPANTIPQLSGGRPDEPTGMYMGGPVMAFAEGGNVSDEDFKRKTGKINGPGTETSDDIPAMLSDGEFVFKSQSVRGAGAFDMNKKRGGIIELVPNKEESRERGTDLMYEMMDLFSSYAKKRA